MRSSRSHGSSRYACATSHSTGSSSTTSRTSPVVPSCRARSPSPERSIRAITRACSSRRPLARRSPTNVSAGWTRSGGRRGSTERLLDDYVRDCHSAGVQPQRIVLTFAPAGRTKTITFLKWLGVHVPLETETAILNAADPIGRSIEICSDNLRRILDHEYADQIPLGIHVERVSINRDEIDASVVLFRALDGIVRERLGRSA